LGNSRTGLLCASSIASAMAIIAFTKQRRQEVEILTPKDGDSP
jgi:cobalamin biosynthesis protein CbiD